MGTSKDGNIKYMERCYTVKKDVWSIHWEFKKEPTAWTLSLSICFKLFFPLTFGSILLSPPLFLSLSLSLTYIDLLSIFLLLFSLSLSLCYEGTQRLLLVVALRHRHLSVPMCFTFISTWRLLHAHVTITVWHAPPWRDRNGTPWLDQVYLCQRLEWINHKVPFVPLSFLFHRWSVPITMDVPYILCRYLLALREGVITLTISLCFIHMWLGNF